MRIGKSTKAARAGACFKSRVMSSESVSLTSLLGRMHHVVARMFLDVLGLKPELQA